MVVEHVLDIVLWALIFGAGIFAGLMIKLFKLPAREVDEKRVAELEDKLADRQAGEFQPRVQGLNELCRACHENSIAKGFWDVDNVIHNALHASSDAAEILYLQAADRARCSERIALLQSEASELLEAYRKDPWAPSDHCGTISAAAEEAADVLIRLGDFCDGYGIDLDEAVRVKMAYNATRPRMHGGKKF